MNFTITINGEGAELGSALRAVKNALEGQLVTSGEVSASVSSPQSNVPSQPMYAHPTDNTNQQQQQVAQTYQPTDQSYQQPAGYQAQNQAAQQQPPVYQQQPVQNVGTVGAGVPVSTTSYDINQLSVAATFLMDNGRQPDLFNLLAQFGIQALTQLPKEHYGAFATQLRALGAKI